MTVYQIVCVCASFPFGFEGGMWDLIVLVPDHCLSFYFICIPSAGPCGAIGRAPDS